MNHKTRVVPLRVPIEIAEYIDGKTTVSRGKAVEEIIRAYQKIETICVWGDIGADELCEQLEKKFMDGEITVEDGQLRVK